MIFTCLRKDLEEYLDSTVRIIPSKPQTPILSGIYIKAENNELEIQANNFELGIKMILPAVNIEEPGEILVGGKYLQEIIHKVTGSTVNISYNESDHIINIKSDTANFKLLCMNAEDFPKIKEPETFTHLKLRADMLKRLIRKTAYACSNENDGKPIFTGCCLRIENNLISMAATNTHRLAVFKEEITDEFENVSLIIPSKTIWELFRNLDRTEPDNLIDINCSNKNVSFSFDRTFMTGRLIDGEFPPYDRVIPKSADTVVTIKVEELKGPVERIALIAKENEYKNMQFIFSQEGINISAESPEIGRAEENIDAKIEGPDLTISFNYNYITDVLKVFDGEEFVMKLTKPLNPVDIREKDKDDFIYIITPIRTN